MKIKILSDAEEDLLEGFEFYERQCAGIGLEFLHHLDAEILKLRTTFQMHPRVADNYRRAVVRHRFPYAIYYLFDEANIYIHMIFDCRKDPVRIGQRLRSE